MQPHCTLQLQHQALQAIRSRCLLNDKQPPLLRNDLPNDSKAHLARFADLKTNQALRQVNRSFRQAGATQLTKLTMPASELGKLSSRRTFLPAVTEITVRFSGSFTDAQLKTMSERDPVILAKIHRLNLGCTSVTDAGLAHLKSLMKLQSLDLSNCERLTDAGLEHLRPLSQLQELNLRGAGSLTDARFAHLQQLTQLQSLHVARWRNFTDASIPNLQQLAQLYCLNLTECYHLSDASLAGLQPLTGLQSLELAGCSGLTDAGIANL